MAEITKNLIKAKLLLENEELIAIPTETVYGLAANALSNIAVTKIFQAKNRPTFNPLILHTDSLAKIENYVQEIPRIATQLADAFWPGPLTMLFHKKENIPDLVTAGLQTVAVRIPKHPLTHQLLTNLDFPLAAPSANPFGYISPTTPQHVHEQLGDKIPLILDGGECNIGIESTIISFSHNEVTILRLGGTSLEAIEKVIGKVKVAPHSTSRPQSPGMLKSHYAPRKKLFVGRIDQLLKKYDPAQVGLLLLRDGYPQIPENNKVILSKSGNLNEAAANFFAGLRYLDNLPITHIFAEEMPNRELGRAINDRLKRASAT